MHKLLPVFALLALPALAHAGTDAAEQAYQSARTRYYTLKRDTNRRKFRHNWLRVAQSFERVAANHPQSARAPDALFTAAETLQELSRISMLPEDLESAITDYRKLTEGYPHHHLADDAALVLGRIEVDRLNQPEAAKRLLRRAVTQNPTADRIPEIKSLLASLERESKPLALAKSQEAASTKPLARGDWKAKAFSFKEPDILALKKDSVAGKAPVAFKNPKQDAREAHFFAGTGVLSDKEELTDRKTAEPRLAPGENPEKVTALPSSGADKKVALERLRSLRKPEGGAGTTLAEQLGLKVRRVVIDAGHGGHDAGAVGRTGTLEKEVSLAVALRLRDVLTQAGLEVVLTREDDVFVPLEQRAKLANEARGDLFISIHCNSAQSKRLHGIETYTLNTASDRYSIRLAARENASSEKRISDLQFILADLATKANTEESLRLASQVHSNLVEHLRHRHKDIRDLGSKQALFYVLLGVKMPAILVETSFLSHPEEEKRLSSKAYQSDLAEAIGAGVQEFLGNRQRVAKVD